MQGIALIGSTLHFSYMDQLEMPLSEFISFIEIANEIVKQPEI